MSLPEHVPTPSQTRTHPHGDPAPEATAFCLFGAGGDLVWRKLVPALFDLFIEGLLPDETAVLGLDIKELSDDAFRERARDGVARFARHHEAVSKRWGAFAPKLSYFRADFAQETCYQTLQERLERLENTWDVEANRIFYLAIPPGLVPMVVAGLGEAGLQSPTNRARLVVEKPFGHDLESARALNATLLQTFAESQVYRIDHYLGKETVQNILAFRFANALFEPLWDRRYIDHVQISVTENVGVGHRGGYYEEAGALRDMVQNHLMQVFCLVAMEAPTSFDADEVRSKKLDVLRSVRPITPETVSRVSVRGQYGAGSVNGQILPAYRDEEGTRPDSTTETYAALELHVDNWRWQGVPFYLRSGKRLKKRDSEVVIQFHSVPHQMFPAEAAADIKPDRLVIHIQPDEGISLLTQAKRPGLLVRLASVEMHFTYDEAFSEPSPDAYETLLLDVMLGDATLFMTADQVEAAWALVMPVLEHWEATPPDFPNYPAGSWGPEEADAWLKREGRHWLEPSELHPDNPKDLQEE